MTKADDRLDELMRECVERTRPSEEQIAELKRRVLHDVRNLLRDPANASPAEEDGPR